MRAFPANGFRAVLWHQGESDSIANVTAANHAALLAAMIAQSRTDAGWQVPWYLAEVSFHQNTHFSQEEPVAAGQRMTVYADANVFLGPTTDAFHLEDANGGKLSDAVHFNAAGLADHAAQWRDVLRGTAPLTPRNAGFEDNRTAAITGLAALADGGGHIVNISTDNDSPLVIGWRILSDSGTAAADGSNGLHNPATDTYAAAGDTSNNGVLPNMSGRHVAVLSGGTAGNHFLHTTRANLQPNTIYTLTAAIGVRDDPAAFGGARLDLLADGQVLATTTLTKAALDILRGGNSAGTFTDASISFMTGAAVPTGQPLAVRIAKTNGAATVLDFDNIRLTTAPTDITLTGSSIAENNAANATVGTLTATDADAGQTHTFSLVAGTGDTDNGSFTITGNALTINASADYEVKNSYAIRIRATDNGSPAATFDKQFTITEGNDAPTFAGYSVSTPYQTAASISFGKLLTKATDLEGHVLTVTAAGPTSAQGGTAVLQSGSILYTPANGFSGADTFPVTIADALGASVIGTVTVNVQINTGIGTNAPALSVLSGGRMGIGFQGIPGRSYQIQRSTNLSDWTPLTTVTAAANGAVTFIDESPPPGSAFYRLRKP